MNEAKDDLAELGPEADSELKEDTDAEKEPKSEVEEDSSADTEPKKDDEVTTPELPADI